MSHVRRRMAYMPYEEEDTCMSHVSYEEEDCMDVI